MTIDVVFKAIDNITKTTNAISDGLKGVENNVSKFADKAMKLNQTVELFDKMGAAATSITEPYRVFESSMAELSAITGIAGDELADLGKTAREIGVQSGLGAAGAVDAFKLLASQIDVSKIGISGLKDLQKETITLAQASGMSLEEAANSMAGTINQFGLEATEANRVINVLAAGSKYGAAEIPELAQSFKVVGAAASAAGLSVESTAGALEVLSKSNIKGAEAGTSLRNIMLKMQTVLGVDFTKTSLTEALDALKPKLTDATYLSKVFGMENIAAAQYLIGNADAVKEMTDRVTATSVASEQAAINTDTWNHRIEIQKAKFNEFFMSLTESNQGVFQAIQVGSQMCGMFLTFSPILSGATALFGGLTKATSFMKTGIIKLFPSFVTLIAQTWAWTAAMLANPVTWIVVGIMALIAAIAICWVKFAEFRAVIMTAWDTIKGFGQALFDWLLAPFKSVFAIAKGLIGALGALFKGDFSGAMDSIKGGINGSIEAYTKPIQTIVSTVKETPGNYNKHLTEERGKQSKDKNEKAAVSSNGSIENTTPIATIPPIGNNINTVAAPAAGSIDINNVPMPVPASNVQLPSDSSSEQVTINYNPTINISSDMTQKSKDDLLTLIKAQASEVAAIIAEHLRKGERGSYGLS